jgi:hypothetical protein
MWTVFTENSAGAAGAPTFLRLRPTFAPDTSVEENRRTMSIFENPVRRSDAKPNEANADEEADHACDGVREGY